MTDTPTDIARIAEGLTAGAARACVRASDEWAFPGRSTFDANGVWALYNAKGVGGRGAIVERQLQPQGKHKREAYRLTPLGSLVRAHLLASRDRGHQ